MDMGLHSTHDDHDILPMMRENMMPLKHRMHDPTPASDNNSQFLGHVKK